MLSPWHVLFLPFLLLIGSTVAVQSNLPEQIHISFSVQSASMNLAWTTQQASRSVVHYGVAKSSLSLSSTGHSYPYTLDKDRIWFAHVVTVSQLIPSARYFYKVGNPQTNEWSDVYDFIAPANDSSSLPHTHLLYGDMGATAAYSLCWNCSTAPDCRCQNRTNGIISEIGQWNTAFQSQQHRRSYSIIHLGDYAYDLDDDNGKVGDSFMNLIQQVAAFIPYQTVMGNHDSNKRFASYSHRFRNMPTEGTVTTDNENSVPNSWYYAWTTPLVRWIVISTEIQFLDSTLTLWSQQHAWLTQQLVSLNRTETPWVIVMGHRSMYCSSGADCDGDATWLKEGPKHTTSYLGLEDLFYNYTVNFYINGHQHNTERMYDIYKGSSTFSTFRPRATTYIVSGAAGSVEAHSAFERDQPAWSAKRFNTYGYSRLTVYNATHVNYQFVETQRDRNEDERVYGQVIDDVWYVNSIVSTADSVSLNDHHGRFTDNQVATNLLHYLMPTPALLVK